MGCLDISAGSFIAAELFRCDAPLIRQHPCIKHIYKVEVYVRRRTLMVSRLQKFGFGMLGLPFLLLAFGCGGGGTGTQLRVLNASPDETSVQVVVDGAAVGSALAYAANTGYQPVKAGTRQFAIEATGTTTNLVPNDATLSLGSQTETTIILAGYSTGLQGLALTDDNTTPPSGTINIRMVNAMPSLGPVDVYVVPPGTTLSSVTPTFPSLTFAAPSNYVNLSIGSNTNYEIYFTPPGNSAFTYMDSGPLSFSSGQNRTVVGVNSASGGAYTVLVLKDLN
jgi:hypothetical protein